MSTDDVLLGLGLVIVLAVGSQLLAGRTPSPALLLMSEELHRRFAAGARLVEGSVNGGMSDGAVALFVVTADGDLRVASAGKPPPVKAGDRVIALAGVG
jgi:hypothetical protein